MSIKLRIVYLVLTALLLLGMWMSTGTMALYAASHTWNLVLEPCQYLANVDHGHFLGTFQFLNGDEKSLWQSSVVLRRLLYPIIAYPLMSLWGFLIGGVVSSVLIHLLSIFIFLRFVARTFDHRAALASALLLSTYPGIMYWIGLPYSYSMIVPCSLLSLILVWKISEERTLGKILLYSSGLGLLFLGYDLLPYFGLATVLILSIRIFRKEASLVIRLVTPALSLICMALPSALVLLYFSLAQDISPGNANTGIYSTILLSYFSPIDLVAWGKLLQRAPQVFYHNYFYSNFIFLPALFLILAFFGRMFWKVKFHPAELAMLFAVFFVWCFGNLAPPYQAKWQIRGEWMARLYQPIFVVLLVYVSRLGAYLTTLPIARASVAKKNIYWGLLILCALGNAAIVFGPALDFKLAGHAYYNFYQHSVPEAISLNTEKYGKRPLGYCAVNEGKKKKKRRKKKGQR